MRSVTVINLLIYLTLGIGLVFLLVAGILKCTSDRKTRVVQFTRLVLWSIKSTLPTIRTPSAPGIRFLNTPQETGDTGIAAISDRQSRCLRSDSVSRSAIIPTRRTSIWWRRCTSGKLCKRYFYASDSACYCWGQSYCLFLSRDVSGKHCFTSG